MDRFGKETMKESGMTFMGKCMNAGEYILKNQDGKLEIWFSNKNHSGYGIKFRGTHLEFARSVDVNK